jgi:hypothetical protein
MRKSNRNYYRKINFSALRELQSDVRCVKAGALALCLINHKERAREEKKEKKGNIKLNGNVWSRLIGLLGCLNCIFKMMVETFKLISSIPPPPTRDLLTLRLMIENKLTKTRG